MISDLGHLLDETVLTRSSTGFNERGELAFDGAYRAVKCRIEHRPKIINSIAGELSVGSVIIHTFEQVGLSEEVNLPDGSTLVVMMTSEMRDSMGQTVCEIVLGSGPKASQ